MAIQIDKAALVKTIFVQCVCVCVCVCMVLHYGRSYGLFCHLHYAWIPITQGTPTDIDHTHINTHINTHVHTHKHTYTHTCLRTQHTHTHTFACIHTHTGPI